MRNAFEEREMKEVDRGHDAEFTVGPNALLAIGLGLVTLCALCFGLGFATGHRDTPAQGALLPHAANTETAMAATAPRPKPSAAPPVESAPAADAASVDAAAAADPDSDVVSPGSTAQGTNPATTAQTPGQWTVKPAMPAQPIQPSAPAGSSLATAPAMALPANALMVQIAAVSHPEDADVLVSALRRRGYAVTVRRDLSDNLLHVQIGPFSNRNDANAMKVKLLNDGYNAIVEP
jgi:cell division septation protein DedD